MTFQPHELRLSHPINLAGCFGRFEAEAAAALIIVVAQAKRSWDMSDPSEFIRIVQADPRFLVWMTPVFQPDFHTLLEQGHISALGDSSYVLFPFRIEPSFFAALQKPLQWCQEEMARFLAVQHWADDGGAYV